MKASVYDNPYKQRIKSEKGFTLIELLVAIVLIGVTLPAVFSLYASLSEHSVQSAIMDQLVTYGQEKMEEIIAIKSTNWDWYKTPNQFVEDESLPDDYHRSVMVNGVSNWGNASIDAWEVVVSVTHPRLSAPYKLTVRLSKYH